SVKYVDPNTGVAISSQPLQNLSSNNTQYQPEQGLRFNFAVEFGTETLTTSTYYTSNWIGTFHVGDGNLYQTPVTKAIGVPEVLNSSLFYFVDTGHENTPYLFNSQTFTTSDSGPVQTGNWSTSTWYGKNTYYFQTQDTAKQETIADHSIKADIPVNIDFTGNNTASITIDSPYSSVELLGSLQNLTGATSITAGGAITSPLQSTLVEGAQITLAAGIDPAITNSPNPPGSISIAGHAVNVELTGTSSQSVTASTVNAPIYLSATQGGLAVNTITAGGDQAVTISAHNAITVAAGDSGLITGGNVTIT